MFRGGRKVVPLLARYRAAYERVTIPLGKICLRLGLVPDMLTVISLIFGFISAYLLAQGSFIWAIPTILIMGLFDVLDGATARAGGTANAYGTVLDHTVDRYVEFLILLGISISGSVSSIWVIFSLFGMVMASYVRARAESTGVVKSCNVGFAGRQEKIALLLFGMILQSFFINSRYLEWMVILCGILSHLTALQRIIYTRRVVFKGNLY
jgi:phosphatidylglycerophosphate synthase